MTGYFAVTRPTLFMWKVRISASTAKRSSKALCSTRWRIAALRITPLILPFRLASFMSWDGETRCKGQREECEISRAICSKEDTSSTCIISKNIFTLNSVFFESSLLQASDMTRGHFLFFAHYKHNARNRYRPSMSIKYPWVFWGQQSIVIIGNDAKQ